MATSSLVPFSLFPCSLERVKTRAILTADLPQQYSLPVITISSCKKYPIRFVPMVSGGSLRHALSITPPTPRLCLIPPPLLLQTKVHV